MKLPEKMLVIFDGQKVRLKKITLDEAETLDELAHKQWNAELLGVSVKMKQWFGEEVTVSRVLLGCFFEIEEDNKQWDWSFAWVESVESDMTKTVKPIYLKKANTYPLATNCVSCGNKLKDPGMGPLYKHCPKCEP